MKIKFPLALAFLTLCSVSTQAQQYERTFRVVVNISANDLIKSEIVSYVSRELRSLKGIVVVDADSDPEYRISVVGVRTKNQGGYETGYALSLIVEGYTTESAAKFYIPECLPEDDVMRRVLTGKLVGAAELKQHILLLGSDLRQMCSSLVADVDSEVFEEERKSYQKLMDDIKKYREQQQQQEKPVAPARKKT